jgi:hypothetical protein
VVNGELPAGVAQLLLPKESPCENCDPVQIVGYEARLVAVAALPLVSAVSVLPERLENAGCEQLAAPDAVTPVAKLLPLHCAGRAASAVAVAALPVVLLLIEAGNVALPRLTAEGVPRLGVVMTQETVRQSVVPEPLVLSDELQDDDPE